MKHHREILDQYRERGGWSDRELIDYLAEWLDCIGSAETLQDPVAIEDFMEEKLAKHQEAHEDDGAVTVYMTVARRR